MVCSLNSFVNDSICWQLISVKATNCLPCSTALAYISVPSKPKKTTLSAPFLDASRQKFWKSALAFLDAISFTRENFTKLNLNIFSKMYGTHFHDWSRFQVTPHRKFTRILGNLRLQVYKVVLASFSWFLHLTTKLFAMKFRYNFWVIRLHSSQKCFGRIFMIFA